MQSRVITSQHRGHQRCCGGPTGSRAFQIPKCSLVNKLSHWSSKRHRRSLQNRRRRTIPVKILRASLLSISISLSMASRRRSDRRSSSQRFLSLVFIGFSFEKECSSSVAFEAGRVAYVFMKSNSGGDTVWASTYLNTSSILTVPLGTLVWFMEDSASFWSFGLLSVETIELGTHIVNAPWKP